MNLRGVTRTKHTPWKFCSTPGLSQPRAPRRHQSPADDLPSPRRAPTLARTVVWGWRYDLERYLADREDLLMVANHVGFCVSMQMWRYQCELWTAGSVDGDLRRFAQ